MNLNSKIVFVTTASFLLASAVLAYSSISSFQQNQAKNIVLFKEEFLETGRELFENSSSLFFGNVDFHLRTMVANNKSAQRQGVIDIVREMDPAGDNAVIIDASNRALLKGYDNPKNTTLFDEQTIADYVRQNILDRKVDFDIDNFDQFRSDTTSTIVPSKIHFHLYEDAGLFVGYSRNFISGKVRIEFIQRQNDAFTQSNLRMVLAIFTVVLIISVAFMIAFIQRIVIKPLRKVVFGLKQVEEGKLDTRLDIRTGDEISLIAGTFNDMASKLKASYSEIAEEKSRLLASINSLSFGFIIADLEHNVVLRNKAMTKLFKLDEDQAISLKQISAMLGGYDLEEGIERCLRGTGVCEMKEIAYEQKILRCLVAPIVVAGTTDKVIGSVLLLEDITEAKVIERSREEFFAVASHELRTPLTAIKGNAELILSMYLDKITDTDMKEMLVDIHTASTRLIGIVNEFLEVSRLEQGKLETKKETFDVQAVIRSVIRDIKVVADKNGISVAFVPPQGPLPNVLADRDRVEQVLVNLIGNAIKFTHGGSITVSAEKEQGSIKVSVTDTGIGISEKNQALLFRKFQQAGEKILARDISQGTGLGLYISHMLVSSMGGNIKLEKSELGKGSTFSFTIPIAA